MTDDLRSLESAIAPVNADEFFLGLALAALVDAMENPEEFTGNEIEGICESANVSLDYWFDKYKEELELMNNDGNDGIGQ